MTLVPASISLLVATFLMRRLAKTQSKSMDELVNRFSVRSAACSCETDRAPIECNIVKMLKNKGFMACDGRHEEGMDIFDELVRVRLPTALHTKYRYCDALIVGVVFVGEGFDTLTSCLAAGESLRFLVPRVWYWIAAHTAGLPLILLTISTLTRQCLTLNGFYDRLYTLCVVVAVFFVSFVLDSALSNLRTYSATSDIILFLFVWASVLGAVFVCWMMGQQPLCWRRTPKHRTTEVESIKVASKLHLSLDLDGPSGNNRSTPSKPQDPPGGSTSSHISSEEVLGETFSSGISKASCPTDFQTALYGRSAHIETCGQVCEPSGCRRSAERPRFE